MRVKGLKGIITIVMVMSLVLAACSPTNDEAQTEGAISIPVLVQEVELQENQQVQTFIGSAGADKDLTVLPKVAGKVKEIYVEQGDMVKKDQVLMKLDDTDYAQSLRQAELNYQAALSNLNQAKNAKGSGVLQAEAQLEQAQDSYEQAQDNFNKTKELYDEKAVSESQFNQAKSQLLQAENALELAKDGLETAKSGENIKALESQLEQAKINIDKARTAVNDTKIKASFEGQVAAVLTKEDEMAGPQAPVIQLVNQNRMTVTLNISESSLHLFSLGKKVEVKVPSIDKTFAGNVTFIAPSANTQTLTFPIEIDMENTSGDLKAGMLVEVKVGKEQGAKELTIPTKAVLGSGDNHYVFVVKDNKVEKRAIVLKEMTTDITTVESGLQEGELVVTKGQYELNEDSEVEIVKEEGNEA